MNANTNVVVASSVFGLTNLKDVPASYVTPNGMRDCRIIIKGDKNPGKVSQLCALPEVTANFAQVFMLNSKGLELVQDFISTLQDKAVRKVYLDSGRSPCEADLSIEKLVEIGALEAVNVRLTKESITAWFNEKANKVALFIASRMYSEALAAITAISDEAEKESSWKAFWASADGEKCIKIAGNYLPLFVELAGRNPSFNTGVKAKLEMVSIAIMEGTALEEKILDKLANAVEKSVDDLGL